MTDKTYEPAASGTPEASGAPTASAEPERVLIGSLQKFSTEDGPGVRTTIFFKGCPLNCQWCHNPEMISAKQQLIQTPNNCIGCGYCQEVCPQQAITLTREEGVVIDRTKCDVCLTCAEGCYAQALRGVARPMTLEEIMAIAEQDKGFYDNTGGGITLSGGEILMRPDFIGKVIDEAAAREINVCLDTCGYGDPKAFKSLAQKDNVTDILYDMKSVDDLIHREYTGVSNKLILDNLEMLLADEKTAAKLTLRMPLIKGVNDTEEVIRETGRFYERTGVRRVDLLPYHNFGINKAQHIGGDQTEFEPPEDARLDEIRDYFSSLGMAVRVFGRTQ